jgi:hypothetical protein
VITWNVLPLPEKDAILSRLDDFTRDATAAKLTVFDPALLEQKVKQLGLRYRTEFSPYQWAYVLLRIGAERIQDLKNYGIEVKGKFKHLSPRQLVSLIDEELFLKSEAHLRSQD